MRKKLAAITLEAVTTLSALGMPVMAATPIGANEKGEMVYSVTEDEYTALVQDIMSYNNKQTPVYITTYSGINFYKRPGKKLVRQTLKGGAVQVWYEDTEKITMYDTTGVFVTNPDGTSETATIPVWTKSKYIEIKDADITGADFLNDAYGLYCQTYLLTSAKSRHPVYGSADESGLGTIYFTASGMYDLFSLEAEEEASVLPAVKKYVTNGMTKDDAISALIRYISDTITYDYGTGAWPIAHPGTSLKDGLGICQDYTGAFCFVARLVPFDENGLVNWETGTRNQLEPQWICTNTHAFNKLVYDGRTRWIDICYYDTTGDTKWLDMTAAEMSEANHANILSYRF